MLPPQHPAPGSGGLGGFLEGPMGTMGQWSPWGPGSRGTPWGPMGTPWDPMEPHGPHRAPWGPHGVPWGPHGAHGNPMGTMGHPRKSPSRLFTNHKTLLPSHNKGCLQATIRCSQTSIVFSSHNTSKRLSSHSKLFPSLSSEFICQKAWKICRNRLRMG